MGDKMADESSTLEDIGRKEFVESMKNKNTKLKTFSDHKIHTYEGFRAVDGIPMTELYKLLKIISDSKIDNGGKYKPHTKEKQKRANLFSADEIQLLYWKGKLGSCKLSNCTLIF